MKKLRKFPWVPYNQEFHPGYAYRKIDLLLDEESDAGEGCWCLLSPKNIPRYSDNNCFLESFAILCNDSKNYSGLKAGQIVPIKFNGEFRATVDLEWLKNKMWNAD